MAGQGPIGWIRRLWTGRSQDGESQDGESPAPLTPPGEPPPVAITAPEAATPPGTDEPQPPSGARAVLRRIGHAAMAPVRYGRRLAGRARRWAEDTFAPDPLPLHYFEDILAVEFADIDARRARLGRPPLAPLPREGGEDPPPHPSRAHRSPDPAMLFGGARERPDASRATVDPDKPDRARMRPNPVACTATGLALSGGGIRSAAVCLGAIQALESRGLIDRIDYLSTVSGGGYIGACLSAAMSRDGGGRFPFGSDVADSPAVAHLRNFSNYLMPRDRSGLRNAAEAAAILLRGMLANAVVVLAVLLFAALVTIQAYPGRPALGHGGFAVDLAYSLLPFSIPPALNILHGLTDNPFGGTILIAACLVLTLLAWATMRGRGRIGAMASDTSGPFLTFARRLLYALLICAFLDLQPFLILAIDALHAKLSVPRAPMKIGSLLTLVGGFVGTIATFSGRIGQFIETSNRSRTMRTALLRVATKIVLLIAALIVPVALWIAYLCLAAWSICDWTPDLLSTHWLADRIIRAGRLPWPLPDVSGWLPLHRLAGIVPSGLNAALLVALIVLATLAMLFEANSYSLNRFYRDRLSRAFLFGRAATAGGEPRSLDRLRLSDLRDSHGPYHIINAALNVQGSEEANKRGRNADFFLFSSRFVGSDLTFYTPTADGPNKGMESVDRSLNLGTAMATSGAAFSANMGGSTIRLLSPTLALLNIRLGYWLRNPRHRGRKRLSNTPAARAVNALFDKFYLPAEMLNLLDETQSEIYLSDGGHIENLGLYELLKRGCGLIVVIDAEQDEAMSFSSLLKAERYARIDLGVRITLPWERIAERTRAVDEALAAGPLCPAARGPHCAIGKIVYPDGGEGMLAYFKSSLSGDEKDYVRDYKLRNPAFPHESTGDQFFSEEQFEMYRALGFHMVDGVGARLDGDDGDDFAFLTGPNGYPGADQLLTALSSRLGRPWPPPR